MHGPPVDGDLIQQSSTGPFIEHSRPGTPHRGKVPAAIQPHSDDVALLCAGTVAKLIQEGYTGYMIRATNDDMGDDVGEPGTVGENVLRNEREGTCRSGCAVGGGAAFDHRSH